MFCSLCQMMLRPLLLGLIQNSPKMSCVTGSCPIVLNGPKEYFLPMCLLEGHFD